MSWYSVPGRSKGGVIKGIQYQQRLSSEYAARIHNRSVPKRVAGSSGCMRTLKEVTEELLSAGTGTRTRTRTSQNGESRAEQAKCSRGLTFTTTWIRGYVEAICRHVLLTAIRSDSR